MKYKLIVLDVDGTLNNSRRQITPRTKAALIKAQQTGAIVVLASGRPALGLANENRELDLAQYGGLLLSYNGGMITDAKHGEILYSNAIPIEIAVDFLKHIEQYPVAPIVDNGDTIYTDKPDNYYVNLESTNHNLRIQYVENIAASLDFEPVKILVAADEKILKPIIKEISLPYMNTLTSILSTPFYLEVTMPNVSKSNSLERICNQLNINPSEVIAFGDAENDLDMIKFAGTGIAMGNAVQDLKNIADEVTHSNDEDGIAHILERYFE